MISTEADGIWTGDHLGRMEEANYLSRYLAARYQGKPEEQGFVLAINGEWGMGKTFMIRRWAEQMEVAGHPVVQFDAWVNDFTPEPLIAFIAELEKALSPLFDRIPAGARLHALWYEKAKAVLIPSIKTAGFALAKHGLGLGAAHLSEIWSEGDAAIVDSPTFDSKALGEKLNKVVDEALKSHSNTKEAIKAFKTRLALLIDHLAAAGTQLPICVFIDELDRCRPNYAIELLEGIKHLFGVPGIYFVVATNINELAHSVRAIYGSGFSADRYLKRFFDMEYALPTPDGAQFAAELMKPLADLAKGEMITGLDHFMSDEQKLSKGLPYLFERYAAAFALPLRDQQQVARILEASILSLGNSRIQIHFLIFLAILYQRNPKVYTVVAKAKNIGATTNFPNIFPQNGEGYFKVPSINGQGPVNISVTQIANVFFSYLNEQHPNSEVNSADFPINLSISLARTEGGPSAIYRYLDIVRRAGGFAR